MKIKELKEILDKLPDYDESHKLSTFKNNLIILEPSGEEDEEGIIYKISRSIYLG